MPFPRIPIQACVPPKADDPQRRLGPAIKKLGHPHSVEQPYDAFLVLDVEATCIQGTDLNWPNEIIEFPVRLLRWKDKAVGGKANQLEFVDVFRSFVKPTWRPQLSQFCTDLTGVTQSQVEHAPTFPEVLEIFSNFLVQHGLIDPHSGERLARFCWCSDGPFDIRDFVVKQCHISQIFMPHWLQGDVLDVRATVAACTSNQNGNMRPPSGPRHRSFSISSQLQALGLSPFQGRQHSGIDDTHNIARIVIELAHRGVRLEPNTNINPSRRWSWMGRPGEILEGHFIS